MQKTVKVTIQGKDYNVAFPNIGQLLEIESMKMSITNSKYVDLAMSDIASNSFAANLADAISTFFVLVPDLRKNLDVKSYSEVELEVGVGIVESYFKQYYPFYKEVMKQIYDTQK